TPIGLGRGRLAVAELNSKDIKSLDNSHGWACNWHFFCDYGDGNLREPLAPAAVGRRAGLRRTFGWRTLPALVDLLQLVHQLRQTATQVGVFPLQLGVLRLEVQESLL